LAMIMHNGGWQVTCIGCKDHGGIIQETGTGVLSQFWEVLSVAKSS